jgi:hypothetical protein
MKSRSAAGSLFALAVTLSLWFAAIPAAEAQVLPSLLLGRGGVVMTPDTGDAGRRAITRYRDVQVDTRVLATAADIIQGRPGATRQIAIPFFADKRVTVTLNRVERPGRGVTNFFGTVDGDPFGSVTITQSRLGGTSANVMYLGKTYQILFRGDDRFEAREFDLSALDESATEDTRAGTPGDPNAPEMAFDSNDTVDVMVVYSTVTKDAAGGTAAIENEIDMGIAVANSAYANSGVTQRVRLVHTEEINYTLDTPILNISNALTDLTNGTNGMSAVATLRNTYGADLVSFWVESAGTNSSACGVAWIMPSAAGNSTLGFNVVVRPTCAVANQSFPHEMGHNMGLRHDVFMDPTASPYAYGHGYVDPLHRFRTVMAYANACSASAPVVTYCPRINNFSSPLKFFQGAVTGIAATADEAHALNTTLPVISAYRGAIASAGTLEMRFNTVSVTEGGTAQVAVARLGGSAGAVSVHYTTVDGTALDGADYTLTTGTLNWANGDAADKFISIPTTQNVLPDGQRLLTVTLDTPGGGAELSLRTTATVAIHDDESDTFPAGCVMPSGFTTTAGATVGWVVATDSAATEGHCSLKSNITPDLSTSTQCLANKAQTQFSGTFLGGNIAFKAKVSSEGTYDCLRFTIDGTEQNIGSCSGNGGLGLTASAGQTETGWQPFSIPVTAGIHTLRWSYEIDCVIDGANSAWIDDLYLPIDPASVSTFAFAQPTTNVIEGAAASVNVAVNRTGPSTGAVSVTWTTGDGTALAGTDFGTLGNTTQRTGTLSWASGDAAPKNITVGLAAANVPVINDTNFEADKDFTLTLVSTTGGALIGAQDTNTVTIADSESTVQFSSNTATVGETGGNVVLTINRTGSTALAQNVTFTTTAGTATATTDYMTTTGTITFAPGETSKTIAVGPNTVAAPWIKVNNDATVEPPETFTVTLSAPTNGAVIGATNAVTVTILSEDSGITMAAATRSFSEAAGAQQILVNRAGPGVGAVSVNYTISNGTAIRGTHFNSPAASGMLNWADGDVAPKAIDVTPVNDAVINTTRMFTVTLSGPTGGAVLAAPMSTAVSITDDDSLVQFYSVTQAVAENVAGGVVTIQLTRSGVFTGPADVTFTTSNGTAVAGTDFGALGNVAAVTGTVSWPAGVGGARTFTIPILNDGVVKPARAFTVQLSSPVGPGVSIGAYGTLTVTINDDDKGVTFAAANYNVQEMINPSVVLTVQRIGPATTTASATWTTVNGTAISGTDFGVLANAAPRTGTITWAMGDAANKTITIPILNNAIGGQPLRLFQVALTPGAGMILGAIGTSTVTISDDDIPPQTSVQFSQPKYNVVENVGNAVLTLTRTDLGPGCGLQSQVNYATVAGTALATSDYTTKTGTIIWAPADGCVDKQITIAIVNNAVAEPPESFKVVLSGNNPGTNLGVPSTATVTILDDDEVFPAQCAMPAGFSTPVGVTAGWHVTSESGAYEGACALRTDQIDDGESAGLEMSGTFVAGNVSFRVKISSELDFDKLTFLVDGVPQPLTWSGTAVAGWTASPTYPLSAGAHALRWVYQKDASASVGMDAAFIDGLVTPAFTP